MKQSIKNQTGSGILQLLVLTATIYGLGLTVHHRVSGGVRKNKTIEHSIVINSLSEQVESAIVNSGSCELTSGRAAQASPSFDGDGIAQMHGVYRKVGTNVLPVVEVGDQVSGGLFVSGVVLEALTDPNTGELAVTSFTPTPSSISFWADLKVELHQNSGFGPAYRVVRPIRLLVVVEGNTMTFESCYSEMQELPSDIHFLWIIDEWPRPPCPTDYVDLHITDDSDHGHEITEGYGAGQRLRLCMKGITHAVWIDKTEDCADGYLETGFTDDADNINGSGLDYYRNLNDREGECIQKLCIRGAQAVDWRSQCDLGWVGSTVMDQPGEHCLADHRTHDGSWTLQFCAK